MAGMLRVPRSRGALSGFLLVLLGVWGGLVPFIGPYFHYAYTPDRAWAYTSGRWWLEILPGLATAVGGLIVLASANRAVAAFGAWLAALGGAWFVVGRTFSVWPATHIPRVGAATGSAFSRTAEEIGFFSGLGVVIVFIAAFALGRFTVAAAREAAPAAPGPAAGEAERPAATDVGDPGAPDAATRTLLGREVTPASEGSATAVSSDT
ncbi:MAG TPA: hypothetical protein VLW50_03445 [Streptosporangiaceae bacterium]|nr:hypothetical protein [Streptosporangiaceae bacterium]